MTTIPELISGLNSDLAREYAAMMQYQNHAAMLTKEYSAFAEHLLDHADDEKRHLLMLIDAISYFGGVPIPATAQVFTASDNVPMLTQDLDTERDGIVHYTERIGQAYDLKEYGTVAMLLEIIKDENHHTVDLMAILDV